ncbi:hypothetical protein [Microbacterium sp. TNHR37B]|uniref:hypothetical protein n=1 Tax=Microbacterium sp. TNHR37B TaxID=1775956 RepID=UPI0007B2AE85|nr:hypothetical protein [Microbacterium sp. TNHR37B]KZE88944.1 hypothetical protein AVP41_01735 [Microbacterium sp. TNHR37B]
MGLNEELDPAEQIELRSRIMAGARSLSARRARRARLIAAAGATAAVAIVVGVSALALYRPAPPNIAQTPSPTATVSAAPTPTATPSPTTPPPTAPPPPLPQTPVAVAGGSCDDVIPSAGLPAAIGQGAVEDVTTTSLHTLGAVSCRWTGSWQVQVDLFPVEVVPAALEERYAAQQCESIGYDGYGCRVARATDDLWALVTVSPGATTYGQDVPEGLTDQVADVIEAGLPDLAPGVPGDRTGWDGFAGCDDVAAAIDLPSALGGAPGEGLPGVDGSSPDPLHEIAVAAGSVIGPCVWSKDVDPTTASSFPALWVTIYPGGAAGWDRLVQELAPTAVDTTVAGAEDAVIDDREDEVGQVGTGDPLTRLLLRDGESIVVLESRELARDLREVAAELLDAR